MTTPDPWRELEAKLSRSGYEDEPPDLTPEEAANYLEPHWELLYPRGPQRPSPEGLHAQKGREETVPLHVDWGGFTEAGPRPPLRCRLGWHRWRRYPWAVREPSAPIRCARCHKEKP